MSPPAEPREDLRARRAARRAAERRRRRRTAVALLTLAAVALAGALLLVSRPWAGGAGRAAVSTGPSGAPPPPASPPRRAAPDRTATGPAAQAAAVARYARLGVPIFRGGGRGRYVALTFDDGPGPYTETALAALRRSGARATFFLVGENVGEWSAALRNELALGALGNHSWDHPELTRLDSASIRRQLVRTQEAVASAGGGPVRLFRPPYGSRNREVDRIARELGMLQVLWDIDSGDSQGATWDQMLASLKREIRPGAIVLLHENRGQTIRTVNRLLPWLRRQGYRMVSVPELLLLDPPSVAQVRRDAERFAGVRMGAASE